MKKEGNATLERVEAYTAAVPRFDNWDEAPCVGFFGYANGRVASFGDAVAKATGLPQPMPCNNCPEGARCWAEMKGKAAYLFPETVEAFERMAKEVQGPELVKRWSDTMGKDGKAFADPYSYTMLIHMQVGIKHEHTEEGAAA